MSSVSGIGGSFIGAIARSEKGSTSTASKSTVLGKEVSTSFDSLSFSPEIFKQAFSDSFIRINTSLNAVRETEGVLTELTDITDQLLKIAHRSAQRNVTDGERATMETRFQKLIAQFKKTVDQANTKGIDFLDKDELAQVLKNAGIDLSAATTLADQFSKIAGSNQKIGRRSVVRDDELVDGGTATISTLVTVYNPDPFVPSTGGFGTYDTIPGIANPDRPAIPGATGDGTFRGSISTQAVVDPWGITVGDYNNDGLDDLAAISQANDSISIMIGNGDGTFKAAVTMASGNTPLQIRSGFINGDSNQDLVAINELDGTISVLIGNGDGTFASQAVYTAAPGGASLKDIQLGDLDGDNDIDIITSDINNDEINILINNGNGTFKARVSAATTGNAYGTALVDMNGDGNLDLAYSDWTNDVVNIQLGDGSGNFGAITSFAAYGGFEITSGDFNGDGNKDIAVASYDQDKLSVLLGNGNGSLKAVVSYASNDKPATMTAVDLNGDGRTDIAIGNISATAEYSTVYLANSDGSFQASNGVYIGNDAQTSAVSSGDFNEDGVVDLVFGSVDNDNLTIHFGHSSIPAFEADGTYDPAVSIDIGGSASDVQLADIQNDGINDLITTDNSTGTLWIQTGNGDGTFKSGISYGGMGSELFVNFGDIDNDGYLDLAVTDRSTGDINTFLNDRTGIFTPSQIASSSALGNRFQLAEVTGDGNLDLIGADGTGDIKIFAGNGNGTFKGSISYSDGNNYEELTLTDYDNDGETDIVAVSSSSNQVSVLLSNGNGTFSEMATLGAATPYGATVADYNGDGVKDIFVTQRDGSGSDGLLFLGGGVENNGTLAARQTFVGNTSSSGSGNLTQADLNNDGKLDLISLGYGGEAAIRLGNGDGTFGARMTLSGTGAIGDDEIKVGDVNADGKLDIAFSTWSDSHVHVYLGNADGTFKAGVSMATDTLFGTSADIDMGDFDGDGKVDIVGIDRYNAIHFFHGNGDGNFSASVSTMGVVNPMAVGDVDSDDILDIIGGGRYWLGNGDGTFSGGGAGITFSFAGSRSTQVADLNGDGFLDSVATWAFTNSIFVDYGNGDGTFKSSVLSTSGMNVNDWHSLSLGDINGDGLMDIVNSEYDDNRVSVFINNGDGTFQGRVSYQTFGGRSTAIGDFNNDGLTDVITDSATGHFGFHAGKTVGTFKAGVSYDIGISPDDAYSGDFNGDGIQDILVSHDNDFSTILYGNGDGTMRAGLSFSTGAAVNGPGGYAIADVTDDGVVEIVSAGGDTGNIYVVHADSRIAQDGSGEFKFGNQITLFGSSATDGIAKGDLNADGVLDLVVGGGGVGKAYVMLGHTDGTFASPVSYSINAIAGGSTANLEVSDFNGDGKLDLLSPVSGNGSFSVALGNGDGTFKANQTFATGGTSIIAHATDLNGDGKQDVVTGGGSNGQLMVRLGNGNGTFAALQTLAGFGSYGTTQFSFADFNNDGKVDIAGSNQIGVVQYYAGNGNGTFKAVTSFVGLSHTSNSTTSAAADLNGDGNIDFVVSSDDYAKSLVFIGNGDGSFKAFSSYISGDGSSRLHLEDLNNDGNLDLVNTGIETLAVSLGNGNGSFAAPTTYKSGLYGPQDFTFSDFNNDSLSDIAVANADNGSVSIMYGTPTDADNTGSGWFVSPTRTVDIGSSTYTGLINTDINDDGILDLVSIDTDGPGAPTGTFQAGVSYNMLNTRDVAFGDFNEDGYLDAIAGISGGTAVSLSLGNSDGSFKTAVTYDFGIFAPLAIEIADINNDNNLDFVAQISNGNLLSSVVVGFGDGTGSFTGSISYGAGSMGSHYQAGSLYVGDLNGDSYEDIVLGSTTYGINGFVEVFFSNSDGTFQAPEMHNIGSGSYTGGLDVTDFNGDTYKDVVIADQSGSTVHVLLGNSNGTLKAPTSFATGDNATAVGTGDFDGDGVKDIAVMNDNHVGIMIGNGNGSFQAIYSIGGLAFSQDIQVDDTNGDGFLDVFATQFGGPPYTFFGNGDGTFSAITTYASGATSIGGNIIDLNGDGVLDLVATDSLNGFTVFEGIPGPPTSVIQTMIGNGDGSYKAAVSYSSTVTSAANLISRDVNGDGKNDLITYGAGFGVSLGNGDGSFNAETKYGGGSVAEAELRDMNRDGILDMVMGDQAGKALISLGNANGSFGAVSTFSFAGASNIKAISVDDFNEDGFYDVAFSENSAAVNTMFMLLGNGDGTLKAAKTFAGQLYNDALESADMNGDGLADLVSTNSNNGQIGVLLGNGNGSFKAITSFYGSSGALYDLQLADFNADGWVDVAATGATGTVALAGYGNGLINWSPQLLSPANSYITAGDFNNDGAYDLGTLDGSTGVVTTRLGYAAGSNFQPGGLLPERQISTLPWSSWDTPNYIAEGDFNYDGKLDAIFTSTSGTAGVMLGNGNGTFLAPTSIANPWGADARAISVADLNNDGKLDYAFINWSSDKITIGFGNSNGTFSAQISQQINSPGGSTTSFDFVDVNGDDILDVVSGNATDSKVSVAIGNGNGTFNGVISYAVSTGGVATTVTGDFDGDGETDVAINGGIGIGQLLIGNGDGTFKLGATFTSNFWRSAQSGDVNNDGKLDLVWGANSGLEVVLGNGDGTFQSVRTYSTGSSPYPIDNIRLADINGDGVVEIVTAERDDNTITVFYNNGDGNFKAAVTYGTANGGSSLAIGDFTGDGRNDILRAGYDGQSLGLLINSFSNGYVGSYAEGVTYVATGGRVESLATADFNEDGITDVLIDGGSGINLQIAFGAGDNTAAWIGHLNVGFGSGIWAGTADFNNDGHADIIATTNSYNYIQLGNGDGTFKTSQTWTGAGLFADAEIADINNDGLLDVAQANYNGGMSVLLGNGDGTLKAEQFYLTGGGRSVSVALADLDHDGNLDALVEDFYHEVGIALGNGDGSFSTFISYDDSGNGTQIEAVDVNSDGNIDVVTALADGVYVHLGYGDGTVGAEYKVANGAWHMMITDDNGDGKVDVVGSSGSQLFRILGNGDGTFGPETWYAGPAGYGGAIARADLNRDGIMDMLIGDYAAGTVTSFLGGLAGGTPQPAVADGTFTLSNQLTFPNKTGMSVAADFNGDGFIDLAVEDTSGIGITLGNGDGSFKAVATMAEGTLGQSILSFDLNGDTFNDLIVNDAVDNVYSVYLGNGDGNFKARASYAGGDIGSGNNFAMAEVNGDLFLDIVGTNLNGNSYSVLLGNTDGSFKARTDFAAGASGVYSVAVGEIDGDSESDLVVTSNNNVVVLHGNGDGTFNAVATMAAGSGTNYVSLSDLDGDSDLDIIATNSSSNNVSIMLGNGNGTYEAAVNYNTGAAPDLVRVGDFNSDGVDDLVVENAGDETFTLLLGVGDGTFGAAVSYDVGTAPHGISVADFDGDTISDLAVSARDDNAVKIYHGNRVADTGSFSTISSSTTVSSFDSAQGGVFSDPLKGLSVKTRARAIMSEKTLKKVKADLQADLDNVRGVEKELKFALQFALAGASASDALGSASSAQALAESIARRAAQVGVNVEQQKLDTSLVTTLLKD